MIRKGKAGAMCAVAVLGLGCAGVFSIAEALSAQGQISDNKMLDMTMKEDDRRAPLDYGLGPGVRPNRPPPGAAGPSAGTPTLAPGSAAASVAVTEGSFGGPVTWPILAIHAVLLPDGRVMSYGTNELGQQGGQFVYDVWDPSLGTVASAHQVLPNTTRTDIFCSGQSLLWESGEVLITGGDIAIAGKRNYSIALTTVFDPQTDTVRSDRPMTYERWYPSVVPLPNGEMLILGGRQNPTTPSIVPEVYNENTGWRTLPDATNDSAFGTVGWYYPRGFQAPNGLVFVLGRTGKFFYLNPAGRGTIRQLPSGQGTLPSEANEPSVMFAPGKILSLRNLKKVVVIDLNGPTPIATPTADTDQLRFWSNMTVLADGKVFLNGGSTVVNQLTGAALVSRIWNPATGQWTQAAAAQKARLYHSIAMLLPDGSVLTASGGAPGPVKNLNAEIFYPPYLYDGTGQPAERPQIVDVESALFLHVGKPFKATVGPDQSISRVTLVRTGSGTHSFDPSQRFLSVSFTQKTQLLSGTLPSNANVLMPGYYMMFVFNQAGVPSKAKIVRILS